MGKIVVGADGSASAASAVEWAAAEAHRRGEQLELVHVYAVPTQGYPRFVATVAEVREGMRVAGQRWLDQAREAVERAAPGVEVTVRLVEGQPIPVLVGESAHAGLVVLGSRGLGGFSGMLLGSVAVGLAAHGRCPVVVVRGENVPADGPVVVGVEGSEADDPVLGFAFEQAQRRGVPLRAVHTWNDALLDFTVQMYPLNFDPDTVDVEARTALEAQLAPWLEKYPGVAVDRVVVRGRPAGALLDRAEGAQLLVVGSRGRGGFAGMLLGSTSHALLFHAACPVAVVRPGEEGCG